MALLGSILVDDDLITSAELDQALAIQHRLGMRVGSALVELGYIDGDTVSRALAAQKQMLAVLEAHFAAADPAAVRLLTPKLADKYKAIPLGFTGGPPKRVVVAFLDPRPDIVDEIAFMAGKRVEIGIACEIVMRKHLNRLYGIVQPKREMISIAFSEDAPKRPSKSKQRVAPPAQPAKPKTLSVPPPPVSAPAPAPARAKSVRPPRKSSRPPPRKSSRPAPPPQRPALALSDALAAIAAASTRDAIGDAVVDSLRSSFGCGLVLIAKDDLALGWKGFAPGVDAGALESISVPLSAPSMLRVAYESAAPFRGAPPSDGQAIHKRLYKLLRAEPREVLVAPVTLGKRVVNLVYVHAIDGGLLPASAPADLVKLTSAVADAYRRILKKK